MIWVYFRSTPMLNAVQLKILVFFLSLCAKDIDKCWELGFVRGCLFARTISFFFVWIMDQRVNIEIRTTNKSLHEQPPAAKHTHATAHTPCTAELKTNLLSFFPLKGGELWLWRVILAFVNSLRFVSFFLDGAMQSTQIIIWLCVHGLYPI